VRHRERFWCPTEFCACPDFFELSGAAFEFDLFSLETLPPGMADTFDRGWVGNVRLNGIGSKALAGTMRAARTAIV